MNTQTSTDLRRVTGTSILSGRATSVTNQLVEEENVQQSFLTTRRTRLVSSTDSTAGALDGEPIVEIPKQNPDFGANRVLEEGVLELEGNALDIEESSVLCEFYTQQGLKTISLPKSLFPEGIRYGMPISLSIDDQDGIRRPIIKLREAKPELLAAEKDAIDELMKSF